MGTTFDLYPLRFRFATCKLRDFSANTLRGAFGSALKKIDADAYARFFAPKRAESSGPSGLADPPRPFVFRMLGPLEVGMNLFLTREPAVELFTRVMAELGTLELGRGNGAAASVLMCSGAPGLLRPGAFPHAHGTQGGGAT